MAANTFPGSVPVGGEGGSGGGVASPTSTVETVTSSGGTVVLPAVTGRSDVHLDITGTVQITLPTPVAGAEFTLFIRQNGDTNLYSASFNPSPAFFWVGGTPAAPATGANARTAYVFKAPNTSAWLGMAQVG